MKGKSKWILVVVVKLFQRANDIYHRFCGGNKIAISVRGFLRKFRIIQGGNPILCVQTKALYTKFSITAKFTQTTQSIPSTHISHLQRICFCIKSPCVKNQVLQLPLLAGLEHQQQSGSLLAYKQHKNLQNSAETHRTLKQSHPLVI